MFLYVYFIYGLEWLELIKNIPPGREQWRILFRYAIGKGGIIYVGKGTGARFTAQIANAIAAIRKNEPVVGFEPGVVDFLRELIKQDKPIGFAIIKDDLTSDEAYTYGEYFMRALGTKRLTNKQIGSQRIGEVLTNSDVLVVFEIIRFVKRVLDNDDSCIHVVVAVLEPVIVKLNPGTKIFFFSISSLQPFHSRQPRLKACENG